MANPFGGADQTLIPNTSHPNYASLVRAFIPRSSSKWVEVVSGTAVIDLVNGAYDADGYFSGTDTTRRSVIYDLPVSLGPAAGWTLIVGVKYNSSGGSSGGGCYAGIVDTVGGTAQCRVQHDNYNRRSVSYIYDSNSNSAAINGTWMSPGADIFATALQSNPTSQKAYTRAGGATYPGTPLTGTDSLGGTSSCNKLSVNYTTQWHTQFVFLYNDGTMSETDINTIISAPGEVLSQAAGPLPKMGRCIYHLP